MMLVPCTIEHIKKLEKVAVCFVDIDNIEKAADVMLAFARTLLHEGEAIACFGMIPMWPSVYQGWAILPEESLTKYPVSISKAAKVVLDDIFECDDVKRIQAAVLDSLAPGHRWIRWLGFKFEGVAKNYGPGGKDDYYMYARTR